MNIGIDFIIAACALFFIGIVLAMIFDSQLSEEDCMINRKFSKWCFWHLCGNCPYDYRSGITSGGCWTEYILHHVRKGADYEREKKKY